MCLLRLYSLTIRQYITTLGVENVSLFKAALPLAREGGDMPISKICCVFKVMFSDLPEMIRLTVCPVLQ